MSKSIMVWDPLVRGGHWIIVAAFTLAYFTEEDLLSVHVWAGYLVGVAVLIRTFGGFVGPNRARFSDFIYPPRVALAYLSDLVHSRAVRYLGHSPAGGAMVVLLLLLLASIVVTGLMTLGADKHAGPLILLYNAEPVGATGLSGAPSVRAGAAHADETGARGSEKREESASRQVHEVLANLTLILVGFHVGGVVLASIVHRENLVLAMIAGRKRVESK